MSFKRHLRDSREINAEPHEGIGMKIKRSRIHRVELEFFGQHRNLNWMYL